MFFQQTKKTKAKAVKHFNTKQQLSLQKHHDTALPPAFPRAPQRFRPPPRTPLKTFLQQNMQQISFLPSFMKTLGTVGPFSAVSARTSASKFAIVFSFFEIDKYQIIPEVLARDPSEPPRGRPLGRRARGARAARAGAFRERLATLGPPL